MSKGAVVRIRKWAVVKLVRLTSRWYDAEYAAYVRCDKGEMPWWWRDLWNAGARRVAHVTLPLARKIDPDNRYIGAEMAEHGWWG